jgi:hypothetical protein
MWVSEFQKKQTFQEMASDEYKVCVKSLTGQTFEFQLDGNEKVRALKARVAFKTDARNEGKTLPSLSKLNALDVTFVDRIICDRKALCNDMLVKDIAGEQGSRELTVFAVLALGAGMHEPATLVDSVRYGWRGADVSDVDVSLSLKCRRTRFDERGGGDEVCKSCGLTLYRKLQVDAATVAARAGAPGNGRLLVAIGLRRFSYPHQDDIFSVRFDGFVGSHNDVVQLTDADGKRIEGTLSAPPGQWSDYDVPTLRWRSHAPMSAGVYTITMREDKLPIDGNAGNVIGKSQWHVELK